MSDVPAAVRLYRASLAVLPRRFRETYGRGMEAMFADEWRERGTGGRLALVVTAAADLVWSAVAVRVGRAHGDPKSEEGTMRWTGTGLGLDLRTTLRALRRAPLFTTMSTLSLGLGFGGVATVYALADHLLLDPVAGVEDPDALVELTPGGFSYPVVGDFQDGMRTLTGVAAHRARSVALELDGSAEARPVDAGVVSGNYFELLGVRAARGRMLTPSDTVAGAPPVAVLSHALWTEMGSPDAVLDREIRINGARFSVVGVAPPGFTGLRLWTRPAVWIPVEAWPAASLGRTPDIRSRGWGWIAAVGRMAPAVTLDAVAAEARGVAERIAAEHPGTDIAPDDVAAEPMRTRAAEGVGDVLGPLLLALGGMSLLALLAAATNVANLLLARSTRRAREMAVRAALGAGRFQIARLAIVEIVTLALLGAGLGVGLSILALGLLATVELPGGVRIATDGLEPAPGVMAVAGGLLLLVVAVAALTPVLATARDTEGVARGDGAGSTRRRLRLRSALAGVQVAVGVVLLAGTLLFGQSIVRALAVDLGFDPARLAVMRLDATLFRDDLDGADAAVSAFVESVRDQAGVDAASWSTVPPLTSDGEWESFDIVGATWPDGPPTVEVAAVGGDFFDATGIALLRGDPAAVAAPVGEPVIVLNEAMAQRYWPGEDPIGARVLIGGNRFRVAAVMADTRFHGFASEPTPTAFGVLPDIPSPWVSVVVRGPGAEGVARTARSLARRADSRLVIADVTTGPVLVDFLLAPQRLGGVVALLFAALALALCLTGVYGVVAYGVISRLRELGVRLTLGAVPGRVSGEILLKNLPALGFGVLAGWAASVALTRWAAAFLFGVEPGDGLPAVLAAAAVLAMALGAVWIPARRAGRVDPVTVLRAE